MRDDLRPLPLLDLSGTPSKDNLPSSTQAEGSLSVEPWAVEEATFFVGLFQKDDAYDPVTYGLAITGLFSMYPQHIVHKATGLNGLCAEHDSSWLPSIARVRQYLEDAARAEWEAEARRQRIREQIAEREEWQKPLPPEEAARRKAKAEEWLRRSAAVREPEQAARRVDGLEQIEAANKAIFERECRADGVDPASSLASPALRRLLNPTP
jgi:hypothetical protein